MTFNKTIPITCIKDQERQLPIIIIIMKILQAWANQFIKICRELFACSKKKYLMLPSDSCFKNWYWAGSQARMQNDIKSDENDQ